MNSQQKRAALAKRRRKQERERKKIADTVVTYVYDLIIEKVIIPVIKREFGFGPVRVQRFLDNLGKVEIYSGMYRANEPISADHDKIRRMKLAPQSYGEVWAYVRESAYDALGLMGYGPKRLERFDNAPEFKRILSWEELFRK